MADAVVDASVWVSRLVDRDAHHRAVVEWFRTAEEEQSLLVSPSLLLPEVAGAISRRTRAPALARRAVRQLLRLASLRLVVVDGELSEEAARVASDLSLRGADAVYAAVARRLQLPLLTLDREQRRRAAAVVEVTSL